MKKLYRLLALLIVFLPFKVGATSLNLGFSCPTSAKAGQTISCNITGSITSGSLNGLSAKFSYTTGLTFSNFTVSSSWSNYYSSSSGFGIGNVNGITGNTTFGVLKVKIPDNAAVNSAYTITVSNLDGSDTSGNSVSASGKSATIKVLSGNNNLSSLKVSNASFNFSPSQTTYSLTINSATAVLTATLADSSASFISGYGSRTLSLAYGTHSYYVKVKAANGDIKTYTLNITRPDGRNNENRLKSLKVSDAIFTFDADVLEYNIKVKESVNKIEINAELLSNKSTFTSGYGSRVVNLSYGNNIVLVKVKAENESERVYTLNVYRSDGRDDNNYLKSLSLGTYKINFSKDKLEYNIKVLYETDKLDIEAITDSSKATYDITDNNLIVGENVVLIKVTAENEQVRTYKINVLKLNEGEILPSTDVNNIVIDGYKLDFKPDKLEYSIEVKNSDPLNIKVELVNSDSIYKIIGNKDLSDKDEITILIISSDLETKEYIIHIVKNDINILLIVLVSLVIILTIILLLLYKKLANNKKNNDSNINGNAHIVNSSVEKNSETLYETINTLENSNAAFNTDQSFINKNVVIDNSNVEKISEIPYEIENETRVTVTNSNAAFNADQRFINKNVFIDNSNVEKISEIPYEIENETRVTVTNSNVAFLDDDDSKNDSFLGE